MILDLTPVRFPVTGHRFYGTRHEALAIPLTSPRLAEACEGRTFIVTPAVHEGEVVLRGGTHVWVESREVETALRARIEGRRLVREGMADVLAWLGETP